MGSKTGTILVSVFTMRVLFPTRALGLLLLIGGLDLVATVLLNAQGRIEEANPLMSPVLANGAGAFALVKGATLISAWLLLARHARSDLGEVRRACLGGSALYAAILLAVVSRPA